MKKLTEKVKVNLSQLKMPKIKVPDVKPVFVFVAPYAIKIFYVLKKIVNWFWKAVKESIAQVWTLLGFFIAWLTLTGTAQQIVGIATLIATALWLITIPLREEKEE